MGLAVAAALIARPGSAQISPGELSAPHSQIDGSRNCLECHDREHGVSPERCLSCHRLVRDRIDSGQGLHANHDYQDCRKCHIEHHGAEFELIWWGERGTRGFAHGETGYVLEGAHARADCRDCHRRRNIPNPAGLRTRGKQLDRTYLGLEPRCVTCHEDPHRGQFEVDRCLSCHFMTAWRPANGFDHGSTDYPLTGRHDTVRCASCHLPAESAGNMARTADLQFVGIDFESCVDCHVDPHRGQFANVRCESCHSVEGFEPALFDHARSSFALAGRHLAVACEKCHGAAVDPTSSSGESFRVYRGLEYAECSDCHRDVHSGRLGPACASCHLVDGWSTQRGESFDHGLARYPLRGKHVQVSCERCHAPGNSFTVDHFESCVTCHEDLHAGQFADRADGGRCDACHDVEGFRPSRYTLTDHQRSAYPLEGSHGAISCDSCHQGGVDTVARFTFASTRCIACHDDLHEGRLDRQMAGNGCATCHAVASWRAVSFDHATTGTTLDGAHATVACGGCHRRDDPDVGTSWIWTGVGSGCADCHRSPHGDQFDLAESPGECERCHRGRAWDFLVFDHDRDARFKLEGAHERVRCAGCHPAEWLDDRPMVRYRPVPGECRVCHAENPAGGESRR